MHRRLSPFNSKLLGIGFAAILVAGCGAAAAPSPTAKPAPRPTGTPASTQASSPVPTESAVPSVSPSPAATLPLPHVDAALEDKLPDTIGGVQLEKLSWPLSTYIASLKGGGDSVLYTPWLVNFGKNADDIDMAVASDLTETENFTIQAIEMPGISAASLTSEFASVASKQGWPTSPMSVGPVSLTEIVDPATTAAGGLGTAYIWAQGDIMYVIVTDDLSLVVEALAKISD
jgi:hypothetical protein